MLRWLKGIWSSGETVEFESAYGLAESVERLRAVTKRSVFYAMSQQQAVGKVTETRVSIQRVIPMVGNAFKPYFIGGFLASDGKVVLRGRFTMHWLAKLFFGAWFGVLGLITVLALVGLVAGRASNPQPLAIVPATIGMLAFGLVLVKSGQWFSRKDPVWLSSIIGAALTTPTALGAVAERIRYSTSDRPIHLVGLAVLIAAVGALLLISAISGVQSFLSGRNSIVTYFEEGSPSRYLAAVLGSVLLVWAYGIYRRYPMAWWAGLALLAYMGMDGIGRLVRSQPADPFSYGPLGTVGFGVTIGAMLIWGWWWYAQRVHFKSPGSK
jgi:hypothetical protein